MPCTIVVPLGNNPDKNAAMRALGANVVEFGRDFDQAREHVEELQRANGLRYVHSANEPLLIAGVATYALEIFEEMPDVEVVLVPIGGGSGACGCGWCARGSAARPRSSASRPLAPTPFTRSWRTGTRVTGDRAATFAEGMATRVTFDLTFGILQRELNDIVTLTRGGARRRRPAGAGCHAPPGRRRRRRLARRRSQAQATGCGESASSA